MMKKLILALLTLLLILTAAACGTDVKPEEEEAGDVVAGQENLPENQQNTGGEDDDALAYWNGLNFGPNLEYAEEYVLAADPGEYLNAAEAAKLTFETAKQGEVIPNYSDGEDYTMTLVDLSEIEGEACYIYRCDGGEFAAGFAYAPESGALYMQGQGGVWAPLLTGDGAQ